MNENYLPAIASYMTTCVRERSLVMQRMEQEAFQEQIPIIPPEVGQYLEFLVTLLKPQRILEIGAAIGYSTLWLHKAFSGISIDTIELSAVNIKRMQQNILETQANNINIISGDALVEIAKLTAEYDLVFVDAQKAQYTQYLELVLPKLKVGGVIVFDNLLWHGQVAGIPEQLPRFQRAAEEVKAFTKILLNHPQLTSTLLPIGDGVGIGVKRV